MKTLLFIPVKKSYSQLWEYYKNDRDIVQEISSEIYYSNNLLSFLSHIFKVEYVYCWWWHTSILQIIIAKILRKKIICTGAIHMFDYSGGITFFKKRFIHRLLYKISLKLADANIFIANDQKRQITSHLKVNNPFVAYSSLEKNHLKTLKRLKEKNKNNQFLSIVSTLWLTEISIIRKGLFETLDALETLKDKDFIFYIVGKKADGYKKLIDKIEKLKIKNKIKIFIDLPTKNKNELLDNANLYIQPSHYEGLGNSVIEAMSRGCVPIVSRFASQPEVVSELGYIVNEVNEAEITKKILQYLNLADKEREILKNKILDYTHKKFSYNLHLESIRSIFKSLN